MRTLTAVVVALVLIAAGAVTQERRPQDVALQAAIRTETVDGNLESAIKQFAEVADRYKSDRATAATALVHLAGCYQKRGDTQAKAIYERILRDFADQKEAVAIARARIGGKTSGTSAMTYRRVWAGPKVDAGGSVSPDGRHLSYVDWDTGDLALRDLIAGTDRRLTDKGGWSRSNEFAEQSVVSRDGKYVAYAWFDGKERYHLKIADLTSPGMPPSRKVLEAEWIAPYDWSPDGKSLAVIVSDRPAAHIAVVSVDDGSLRNVRPIDWQGVSKVLFSPDGRQLACDLPVGSSTDERDVHVLAVNGSGQTVVAPNPGRDLAMGWSSDGSRLLFASDRSGTTALWAQAFINGAPHGAPDLVKSGIGHIPLGVTTTGALHVGLHVEGRNIYVAEVDFTTGKILKSPERPVDRFIGMSEWPDWSRDGKFLSHVYARNWLGRNTMIAIRSLDDNRVREIPLNLTNSRNPLWAPNGLWFVAQGMDAEGRRGIYRIDAQDGAVTPIAHSAPEEFFSHPEIAPDGARVYYLRVGNKVPRAIVERDLQSGSEREVLQREGVSNPNISPDGRLIATIQRTMPDTYSALLVVPVSGGEPREVLRVSHPQVLTGNASWAPDNRQVMVNTFWQGSERRETWLVPIDGGPTRKLDFPGHSWGKIRVHPDGRRIAYHAGQLKYEVWVLENFLK